MSNAPENKIVEKIKSVNERAQAANTRIIQLNTQKEQVSRELSKATENALQKFGTSDIDELRKIYRQRAEMQSKEVLDFEKNVSDVEKIIFEINSSLQSLESQNNA